MGFNFGAALGGFSDQVVKDIETQEKDVKLRTRTILDRHVAETAANRKEYKANKKKVTEQLNSIAAYFGDDDPDRWNKARAIVAGGDSHVAKMNTIFTKAQTGGQSVDEVYKFTKSSKDVGFSGVEDTAGSLVKLATIAKPDFGASGQTSTLFGATNLANVYEQGRSQYEKSGLLDAPASMSESGATYGSGQLDLTALKQDAKSIDVQIANADRDRRNSKPGTPEHIEAEAKYQAAKDTKFDINIGFQQKKMELEAEAKGSIPTLSQYASIYNNGLKSITDKYKAVSVIGPDGKPVYEPQEIAKLKVAETNSYYKKYIKTQLRAPGGLNSSNKDLIESTPELSAIFKEVQDELAAEKETVKKDGDKSIKPTTRKEKFNAIVTKNKEVTIDTVRSIKELYPNMPDTELFKTIEISYPKKETESDKEYIQKIGSLVKQLGKESSSSSKELKDREQLIKESSTYNPSAKQVVGTYLGKTVESENGKFYLLNDSGKRIKNLAPAEVERIKKVNNDKA